MFEIGFSTFELNHSRNNTTLVYCATKENKIYFASMKFDAQAKRG